MAFALQIFHKRYAIDVAIALPSSPCEPMRRAGLAHQPGAMPRAFVHQSHAQFFVQICEMAVERRKVQSPAWRVTTSRRLRLQNCGLRFN